jgi:hypothetical protein
MIERQKVYVTYLEQLAMLLEGSDITHDLQLKDRVSKTELLVPVIGAFSAGKSSLLNALLGQEILPVGIAPETELATELRYSPEPYLLAVHIDGREERLPVDALRGINSRAKELSHLQLYIDSHALKRLAPLVLVDMPGYGSSLESHNKAISFYLPRGVHFVVVTSVEDGNLTQSMVRRLDEVKAYGGTFTFVLSKCNLRSATQVEQVRGYIDEQLQVYFEGGPQTLLSGKGDIGAFSNALEQIDPNALFDGLFLDLFKGQSHDVVRQINVALNTLKKDDGQSERELRDLDQALNALQHQKANMQQEVRDRYSSRLLNRCLRGLEEDLEDAVEELVALAANPHSTRLNNTLSEVVRNSLTRNVQREIDDISSAMIDELAAGLSTPSLQLDDLGLGDHWVTDLSERVKDSLAKTNQMLNSWSTSISERTTEMEKVGRFYKGVSVTLAVATSVITPVLELAIIFLPEIMRAMNAGNERQRLRDKLQSEVFPGIKAELRNRLPHILDEQMSMVLAKINQSFEEQIGQQLTIINVYRQRSDATKAEADARHAVLEELGNSVKALATQYLYF